MKRRSTGRSKKAKKEPKRKANRAQEGFSQDELLDPATIQSLMNAQKHQIEYEKSMEALWKPDYNEWVCQLKQGLNLLFYGFGSKLRLLEDFANESFNDGPFFFIVNGYQPRLSLRYLLDLLADMIDENTYYPTLSDYCTVIERSFNNGYYAEPIYVVIHNIDSESMRTSSNQYIINFLSNIKQVHIVASVDKVNSALMWSDNKNWIWQQVNTFSKFLRETRYMDGHVLSKHHTHKTRQQGASYVLQTLPEKTRAIFCLLAEQLVTFKGTGLLERDFYDLAAKSFLTNDIQSFKAQLVELTTHDLITTKKEKDGKKIYGTTLDVQTVHNLLKQFKNETST